MNRLIPYFIVVLFLIAALAIPSVVLSKEYEVELNWRHSGIGMNTFVFVHAVTESGPWKGPLKNVYSVDISDLNPIAVDRDDKLKEWKTTITINVEGDNEPIWWVCYAKTSYEVVSDISEPVMSKFVLEINPPGNLRNTGVFFKQTLTVHFI